MAVRDRSQISSILRHLCVLQLIFAAACTASNGSDVVPEPQQMPLAMATGDSRLQGSGKFPEFPGAQYAGTLSTARAVSASQVAVDGASYASENAQSNANYVPGDSPTAYVLVPGGDDPLGWAWAMYAVSDMNVERPSGIRFAITASPIAPGSDEDLPLNCYVLIADFTANRWRLHGPFRDETSLQQFCSTELVLNSSSLRERFIDQSGHFYFAVVTVCDPTLASQPGEVVRTAARVDSITISTKDVESPEYINTWPQFIEVLPAEPKAGSSTAGVKSSSALDPSQYVSFGWMHIDDYSDFGQNEAKSYEVRCGMQWQGVIYGKFTGDQSEWQAGSVLLNSPNAHTGWNSFEDNGVFSQIVPGCTYWYYVRGKDSQGNASDESWWSSHKRTVRILPPSAVQASLDEDLSATAHPDSIHITWDKPLGTSSFELYRNTVNNPVTAVLLQTFAASETEYYDEGVELLQYYYYWVKAVGLGDGDPSTPQEDGEVSAFSSSARGLRHTVLTISCEEVPAPSGSGTASDPWLLDLGTATEYQFKLTDQDGTNRTSDPAVTWSVLPPIAAQFAASPRGQLTNIFLFAGDFSIRAELLFDIYAWQADAYCRVANEQP